MSTDATPVIKPRNSLMSMMGELKSYTDELGENNADNSLFVMDLMETILNATSVEEVFEAQESGMTSGKDFVDRPFIVDSIEWRKTSQTYIDQGAFHFYAILQITTVGVDNPEKVTINTGGSTVCAVLFKLEKLGYFAGEPKPLMLRSTPTSDGKAFLQLTPVKVIAQTKASKK